MKIITHNPEETIELGKKIAVTLLKGDVILLYGDLGSGKTTFTKGIGEGLGLKSSPINSPTFVLVREYKAKLPIYHLDLYRLDRLEDIEGIGIEEYLYGDGVTIIEWAEKIKDILPKRYLSVKLKIKDKDEREIIVEDIRD